MKASKLSIEEINTKLQSLNNWKFMNEGIEKDFTFKDFNQAFAFLTRIAMLSEKMDHHAEWSGVYNKVHIRLSTHDSGGVTSKDTDMATSIEKFL
ncbi:MAG: 4a-hydroxytetrahydrobiopterin dehydratase [Ferruginibacter sp.]